MRYTKNEIPKIPLTEFMAALGEKPVKTFDDMKLYYAPQRDDPEPMLLVDTKTNRWYDHATDETGNIIDLAALKMNPRHYTDPRDFILKYMNEYEQGKEMSAMARRAQEPVVIDVDVKNVRLTDFMKALGQEHPVASDGNLRIYKAPYGSEHGPTMLINIETNRWRDTSNPQAYGGIYSLASELTGTCNMSELNRYIAGEMATLKKMERKHEQPRQEKQTVKPKRKMRL